MHFEVLVKEEKKDSIEEYVVAYEVGRKMYD